MPKLLPRGTKQELLQQITNGNSINAIARSLHLGKSTIYYHYKKIRGRKNKPPQFNPQASEAEGEICGIFAGDGSQYFEPKKFHYEVNVHFGGHREPYARYVKSLFESFFHKEFRLRREKSGAPRLRTQSKTIFCYFKHYLEYIPQHKHDTVQLKERTASPEFKKGFLRGLFDTDGCLWKDVTNRRLRAFYYTTSEILSRQTIQMLAEFGVSATKHVRFKPGCKPIFVLQFATRSIDTFLKHVKPFKARWAGS
ncbi:hypothetical protein HY493_00930 [Candidatus Woesearchaeota archaeon]|nr:hypothetical protein [Candidatus Woesearchaeota archaeon]